MFSFCSSTGSSLLLFRFVYSLVCFLKEEILPNVFCRRAVVEQKRSVLFPLCRTFKPSRYSWHLPLCVACSVQLIDHCDFYSFLFHFARAVMNHKPSTRNSKQPSFRFSVFTSRYFIWSQVIVVNKRIHTGRLTDTYWNILEMQNGNKFRTPLVL